VLLSFYSYAIYMPYLYPSVTCKFILHHTVYLLVSLTGIVTMNLREFTPACMSWYESLVTVGRAV